MASPMYRLLPFGTIFIYGKQIKFGLDNNSINQYDQQNNRKLRNQLIELLNKFESLFVDQPQYLVKFEAFFTLKKGESKYWKENNGELAPWEHPNPQLDEQKKNWLKIEISKLIEAGIISKVNETSKYINSVDVISKNNKFEFNPNFIELNRERGFTCKYKRMILRDYLQEIIFSIPPSSIFSKLVIKDAAFQFELDEKYRKYTTFKLRNDKDGKDEYYQFNRFHPNMRVVLVHMQMQYEYKFEDLIKQSKLKIFCNEFLIFSNSIDDHIDKLNQILMRLKDASFKISLDDSMILFHEIDINEFRLDGEGISLSSKIKEIIRDFQPTTLEDRTWFRSIMFSYRRFCSLSDKDYNGNKIFLKETCYREGDEDSIKCYTDTVNSCKSGFLNSKKISYEPQNSRQSSQQKRRTPRRIPLSLKKFSPQIPQQIPPRIPQQIPPRIPQHNSQLHHYLQQNLQQISPQIPQHNSQLHQYLKQNLTQYLQHNSYLQQYLQQQIIQKFEEQYLQQEIIQKFEEQYQQQIIQQFLQQYQQQYPPEFLNQYLQQNTHLQQITLQFLQQYLQQPNPHQYPSQYPPQNPP